MFEVYQFAAVHMPRPGIDSLGDALHHQWGRLCQCALAEVRVEGGTDSFPLPPLKQGEGDGFSGHQLDGGLVLDVAVVVSGEHMVDVVGMVDQGEGERGRWARE